MNTTKIIVLTQPFQIKPYSKTQLIQIYRPITLYVLNKWLKKIEGETGPIICRMLSVKQVMIFIEHYGLPQQIVSEAA